MKPSEGGKTRENPEPGSYQFRFCSVIDYGTQKVEFEGKEKKIHQVNIGYEILGEQTSEGEHFVLYQKYTLSSSKKANLMAHLNGWYGKDASGLELETLPGKIGNLVIIHNEGKNGKTYANISSLAPLRKNEKQVEKGKEPLTYFSLDEFDKETFEALPDWQKNIIMASDEFLEVDETKKKKAKKK